MIVVLLSIGIMLDYEDDLIHGLVQLIKDREAKDYIYDTLIRYRFLIGKGQQTKYYIRHPIELLSLLQSWLNKTKQKR